MDTRAVWEQNPLLAGVKPCGPPRDSVWLSCLLKLEGFHMILSQKTVVLHKDVGMGRDSSQIEFLLHEPEKGSESFLQLPCEYNRDIQVPI